MITYSRSSIRNLLNDYKQQSLDNMAKLAMESITRISVSGGLSHEWVIDYYITPQTRTLENPPLTIEEILVGIKARFPECSVTHEIRPKFYADYKQFIKVDWS